MPEPPMPQVIADLMDEGIAAEKAAAAAERYWKLTRHGLRMLSVDVLLKAKSAEFFEDVAQRIDSQGLTTWIPAAWHYGIGKELVKVLKRELPDVSLPMITCSPMGSEYPKPVQSTWPDFVWLMVEAAVGRRDP